MSGIRAEHTPSDEQRTILENRENARVRIVIAAPGSGKTWLVGEFVRRELEKWTNPGGIAALSFTRVAKNAIADALGGQPPPHPHFVGTLDAFAYRYLLRPFGRAFFDWLGELRLVPAEVAIHLGTRWGKENLTVEIGNARPSLFDITLQRNENGRLVLVYKTGRMRASATVPESLHDYVLGRKRWLWKTIGVASHSDIAYLCWSIGTHPKHGKTIRTLLTRRFPVIVMDEAQDAGWFLSETIHALLQEPSSRGMIVGDRDQSIYEFVGALPDDVDRFEALEGAHVYPMRTSFRCPTKVCRVASRLSWRGASVNPAEGAADGTAILLVYEDVPDMREVCHAIEVEVGAQPTTILARSQAGLGEIVGGHTRTPDFGSRALRHIWDATVLFRRGECRGALGAASAALSHVAFGSAAFRDADLSSMDQDEESWRILSVSALMAATSLSLDQRLFDWGSAANQILLGTLDGLVKHSEVSRRLRQPKKTTKEVEATAFLENKAHITSRRCDTVHGAKGETHQVTLLFVPRSSSDRCPATTWFSDSPEHGEERRVGFVAVTRPRQGLVLCVHRTTFERLAANAPDFVAEFDVRDAASLKAQDAQHEE